MNLFTKQEIESQMQKIRLPGEGGEDKLWEHGHVHATAYKTDNE